MTGIPNYDVERPRESLLVQPEPDRFTHESPIRAFTDWTVNGRYAIGKGFRPSLQHLTVYLDAMERLEGWALLQVLEAASGSPSFVFRRLADSPAEAAIRGAVDDYCWSMFDDSSDTYAAGLNEAIRVAIKGTER